LKGYITLKITGIEHLSINVRDMQKSKDFYTRIMGFNYIEMVDCGDFDIHYFAIPGGARLELFDYRGESKGLPREESEVGLRHLAFQVEDVAAHEKALCEAGVEITLPTCDLPNLHARVCLFLDPNGVTLEFCEKL
jgi:catechol 2,3-dioxygenase-like lactoylglutathione lyase family enzyme